MDLKRLLIFTFLLFLSLQKLEAQNVQCKVNLQLGEDEKTLSGTSDIYWPKKMFIGQEIAWIEFWPLALSNRNSVLAEQWLEDQNTSFHFAKPKERIGLDSLVLRGKNNVQIDFQEGRSPEILRFNTNQLSDEGDYFHLHVNFSIQLPSEPWADFGRLEDGILLRHFYPRPSWIDSTGSYPSVWLREEDRNRMPTEVELEVSVPKGWMAFSELPRSGASKEDVKKYSAADFQFLSKRSEHTFLANAYCGDGLLFLSKKTHPLSVPNRKSLGLGLNNESPAAEFILYESEIQQIYTWLKNEYGIEGKPAHTLLFSDLPQPKGGSEGLFILPNKPPSILSKVNLSYSIFTHILADKVKASESPWLVKGIADYLSYEYIDHYYPEQSLSGPYQNTLIAWFFDTDDLPLSFKNQLLHLFLARQGLVQPSIDSAEAYTRGTYEAQMRGLSSMQLNYLHDALGKRSFKIGLNTYLKAETRNPARFEEALSSVKKTNLNWFFKEYQPSPALQDIKLIKTEDCPSLFTVTTKSAKKPEISYPVSGFIGDSLAMTEWFPFSKKKVSRNFYKEDYTLVRAADPMRYADLNGKNNFRKTKGWFKGVEPIRLQAYTSFENPKKTQVFWLPSVSYNAYDQLLLGISLYNNTLIPKKFEYNIGPEFSTGTSELTGYASFAINQPYFTGPIRSVKYGLYFRRYHYDRDLAYNRISPGVSLYFRKKNPRDPFIRSLRMRGVFVQRELAKGDFAEVGKSGYSVFNLRYTQEYTKILNPSTLRIDFQTGDLFSKLSVEWDKRFMLNNRKWMILRLFGGIMPYNNNGEDLNLFDFGVSGTQDYLFDYYFIGRSEESGIWSQQFFSTDGGFRNQTDVFARDGILSTNLSIPIYSVLGVYGDLGMTFPDTKVYYGYGMRMALLTDFLEVYFPIQANERFFLNESHYSQNIRFILNLKIDAIINRLRRGFY